MIPRKDVGTLVRAMKVLHDRKLSPTDQSAGGETGRNSLRFRLHLVGGGRGEDRIRSLVRELGLEDSVVLTGKMPPDELWPFLAEKDIFVFPSLSEGFPNAVMEAMACGLPIISSDFSGIDDLIRSEENGLVFPRGDASALADRIQAMSRDPDLKRIGRYNREFVRQFTWEAFLGRFEEVIDGLSGIDRSAP
jgi:glycosyltransferase involved in cell wall biosynthesis